MTLDAIEISLTLGQMDKSTDDVAVLTGPTPDKKGMRIVRFHEDTVSVGEVRPVEDGKPFYGDLISLSRREGAPPFVRNVEVVVEGPKYRGGPAQVATDGYRQGWEATFSPEPEEPVDRASLN
jgi:hypothetical protein